MEAASPSPAQSEASQPKFISYHAMAVLRKRSFPERAKISTLPGLPTGTLLPSQPTTPYMDRTLLRLSPFVFSTLELGKFRQSLDRTGYRVQSGRPMGATLPPS